MQSVYGLVDPRTEQVRYIGVAQDVHKRYAQHLLYPHRNDAKNEWLSELKDAGLIPSLITIEANINDSEIHEREKYWIRHYLAQGFDLTNSIHRHPLPQPVAWPEGENFLDLEQVAKILGVSKRTVLRLLAKREIKGFKVGRAWRFAQSDIDVYVEQQRKKAEEQPSPRMVYRSRQ